jgi:phosphoribosylaminoimidazole-succinocarboxamide synthase
MRRARLPRRIGAERIQAIGNRLRHQSAGAAGRIQPTPPPIFTPATKAETGHDENIRFDQCSSILGKPLAEKVRDISLGLYSYARDYAATRGIIIADTKFEFGLLTATGKLLIDEVLTPDSSRFWPADGYSPGKSQPSFDKQFVRDYLETLDWDKTPPGRMK